MGLWRVVLPVGRSIFLFEVGECVTIDVNLWLSRAAILRCSKIGAVGEENSFSYPRSECVCET